MIASSFLNAPALPSLKGQRCQDGLLLVAAQILMSCFTKVKLDMKIEQIYFTLMSNLM